MKQVILLRTDLGMSVGKCCAQAAHASVQATLATSLKKRTAWEKEGMKKVVLQVSTEQDLLLYAGKAKKQKIVAVVISDGGLTEVKPGTKTAAALGPDDDSVLDAITGHLKKL